MRLTFTGIDEKTDLEAMGRLAGAGTELAVLVGTPTGHAPRFPKLDRVIEIRETCRRLRLPSAIHLCGPFAQAVNQSRFGETLELCRGFGRVQVNAPANEYRPVYLQDFREALGRPVIVRHRMPYRNSRPWAGGGIAYLFDRSGRANFDEWSPPWNETDCGYAGGVTPENIREAVARIGTFPRDPWIEIEGAVRTEDRINLQKVEQLMRNAREAA